MNKFEGLQEGPLSVQRLDDERGLVIIFAGKSILRDPSEVLQPALMQVVEEAQAAQRTLVLDFRELKYMNSASFTPVIKTLEKARMNDLSVTVLYSSEKRWQSVSFAALNIFETSDGRVSIEGM